MSADNGVYVVEIPTKDGGKEWRVIEAMAIDNVEDSPSIPQEITDLYRVCYYGEAKTFHNEDEASDYAEKLSEQYDILEYGVCGLEPFNRPLLEMDYDTASKKLDEYWEERAKARKKV